MQFKEYTIGSAVGILPGVCLYVAIGHLASSITQVVNGDVDTEPWVLILSVSISIVFLLVVVVILTRYAKKALAQKIEVAVEDCNEADGQPCDEKSAEAQLAESGPAQTQVDIGEYEAPEQAESQGQQSEVPSVEV